MMFKGCAEGVHRFEARYETEPAGNIKIPAVDGISAWSYLEMLGVFRELNTRRTYVRDVCVRCGKTIERGEDE